jgi:hypothetical protein
MQSRIYGLRNEPNPVFAPGWGSPDCETKPIRRRLASLESRDAVAPTDYETNPIPRLPPGRVR